MVLPCGRAIAPPSTRLSYAAIGGEPTDLFGCTIQHGTCASLVPRRLSRPGANTGTHRSGSFLDRKVPKFAARSLITFRIINHPKR